jgi:hypothetical protein
MIHPLHGAALREALLALARGDDRLLNHAFIEYHEATDVLRMLLAEFRGQPEEARLLDLQNLHLAMQAEAEQSVREEKALRRHSWN